MAIHDFFQFSKLFYCLWRSQSMYTCKIITVRNEVAKVMFLQVCVCPQGGGIPGCLVTGVGGGGACSGGSAPGGGAGIPACTETEPPPRERWLLLRTVRIPLECILVVQIYCYNLLSKEIGITRRYLNFIHWKN